MYSATDEPKLMSLTCRRTLMRACLSTVAWCRDQVPGQWSGHSTAVAPDQAPSDSGYGHSRGQTLTMNRFGRRGQWRVQAKIDLSLSPGRLSLRRPMRIANVNYRPIEPRIRLTVMRTLHQSGSVFHDSDPRKTVSLMQVSLPRVYIILGDVSQPSRFPSTD